MSNHSTSTKIALHGTSNNQSVNEVILVTSITRAQRSQILCRWPTSAQTQPTSKPKFPISSCSRWIIPDLTIVLLSATSRWKHELLKRVIAHYSSLDQAAPWLRPNIIEETKWPQMQQKILLATTQTNSLRQNNTPCGCRPFGRRLLSEFRFIPSVRNVKNRSCNS
jgi:hypothetical protein